MQRTTALLSGWKIAVARHIVGYWQLHSAFLEPLLIRWVYVLSGISFALLGMAAVLSARALLGLDVRRHLSSSQWRSADR